MMSIFIYNSDIHHQHFRDTIKTEKSIIARKIPRLITDNFLNNDFRWNIFIVPLTGNKIIFLFKCLIQQSS